MESISFITVENLTKRFGPVLANDALSLRIRRGEIHCLLGENGAGKTTLAECLYGFHRPDSGEIRCEGRPVSFESPRDAIEKGIGMVHQHFVLIRSFSVLENVALTAQKRGMLLDLSQIGRELKSLCREYHVDLDLKAAVWQLSVGEQQWVEILKALFVGAELLILDEPTAVLTPQETERLFAVLRQMKSEGLSILLITHKLGEVMRVADRISVLRDGRLVDTVAVGEVDKQDLAHMMVGREVVLQVERENGAAGAPLLEVDNLRVVDDRDRVAVRDVSFTLHSGEILGLAGVAGNGQRELFEALIGVRRPMGGQVRFEGEDITNSRPRDIQRRGIAHVPDDRMHQGVVGDLSVADNLILGRQRATRYRRGPLLDRSRIGSAARDLIDTFAITTPSLNQKVRFLSGGNLQKVILARELGDNPGCLLANQPTRGLDVGVIEYVHTQLLEMRRSGAAVLLISEDLDELFGLSDRIMIMFEGAIMGVVDPKATSVEEVGLMMAGIRDEPR